jgi:hypothetical protein
VKLMVISSLFICFIPAFALVSIPDFSFIKDFTLRPSAAELLKRVRRSDA